MRIKTLLLLVTLAFLGLSASAVELQMHGGEHFESATFQDDYMFLGESLEFKGEVEDLFFAGEEINHTGTTKLGTYAAGRNVNISGVVGNGIIAVGKEINIAGQIRSTNLMAAETINITKESQIDGDLFMAGRIVNIDGKIDGNAYIAGAEVMINNTIQGDVKIHAGQVKIGESGQIIGNLSYESDIEMSPEEAARVSGNISFEQNDRSVLIEEFKSSYFNTAIIVTILFKVSFIVCGLLFLFFPVMKRLEAPFSSSALVSNSLWGLIPILIYPSAIVLFIILVITLPLAVTLMLGFFPLIFITKIIGITLTGNWLVNAFNINTNNRFAFFTIGALIYTFLSFIPIFGFLLLIFVSSIGCGVIISSLFGRNTV